MSFITRILVICSVCCAAVIAYRPVQLVAIISCAVFFLSWIYLKFVRAAIHVRRIGSVLRCFRDSIIDIEIEIANRGIFPVSNFRYFDPAGKMFPLDIPRGNLTLDANSRKRFIHRAEARERGRYPVGPVTIKGRDPLGFYNYTRKYEETGECIVYPRVHPLEYLIEGGVPMGYLRTENPLYEDVSRYRSIREYVPGDSITHISWKHSAKTGELYTREFLPTYNYSVIIALNLCASDYPLERRYVWIERMIELTASLVFHIIRQKQQVGLICTVQDGKNSKARSFPILGGESHGMQILEYLACLDCGPKCDFMETMVQHRPDTSWNTRVVYAGPLLDEEKMSGFNELWPRAAKIDYLLAAVSTQNLPRSSRSRTYSAVKEFGEFGVNAERA